MKKAKNIAARSFVALGLALTVSLSACTGAVTARGNEETATGAVTAPTADAPTATNADSETRSPTDAEKRAASAPSVDVGVNIEFGTARSLIADSAVASILIQVFNSANEQVGSGYLTTKGTDSWSGSVVVHDTGIMTFKAAALDASLKELYCGEAQTTVSPTGSSVSIPVTLISAACPVIIYDANGATAGWSPLDTDASATRTEATVVGNQNGLMKTGYVFTGWNTKSDGSGKNYPVSSSLALNGSGIVLYARWVSSSVLSIAGTTVYSLSSGFSGELMIPPEITKIIALSGVSSLTKVYLPAGLTSISSQAFNNDTGLISLFIGGLTLSFGDLEFSSCAKFAGFEANASNGAFSVSGGYLLDRAGTTLVRVPTGIASVSVPDGVTTVGTYSFKNAIATAVSFPSSLTTINSYAFSSSGLTSITIPSTVTAMDTYAFSGCAALTSVTVLDGLSVIPDYAFYNCAKLATVSLGSTVASIGKCAFFGCPFTVFTIPKSVMSIGTFAFSACTKLTDITVPASVTSIGIYAFSGCTSLASALILANVSAIPYDMFYQCSSLATVDIQSPITSIEGEAFCCCPFTSFTIPDGVTSIGTNAFADCRKLTSITLPASVTSIGTHVFSQCFSLSSVTIQGHLASIPDYAFYSCEALSSFAIPSGVTSIGGAAFSYCTALTACTIPDSVKSIGGSAFSCCTKLTDIAIPSSVKNLGGGVFQGCTALASATINATSYELPPEMFEQCTALASVSLSESIVSIDERAFNSCSSLTSVTIPATVTTIGQNAFSGCLKLATVTFEPTTPPQLYFDTVFKNCSASLVLRVPNAALPDYENSSSFQSYYLTNLVGY